jgi:hypothetical protein
VTTRIKASIAAMLASAVLLSGCGSSPSATYTGGDGSYLRLPGTWNLFDGNSIIQATDPEGSVSEGVYISGFSLGSKDAATILTSSTQPNGLILSTDIPEGATAENDRAILISNINEMLETGVASVIDDYKSFVTSDGVTGERSVIDVVDVNGKPMRLLQQMITNKERTRIWVLAVGCNKECFVKETEIIEQIAKIWKVDVKR